MIASVSAIALHLYLLTRFSNTSNRVSPNFDALHLYLLTRFSNRGEETDNFGLGFTPLFTYKVLKLYLIDFHSLLSFTPLFTYKVLKLYKYMHLDNIGFTPLFTYKVLKQYGGSYYA